MTVINLIKTAVILTINNACITVPNLINLQQCLELPGFM